MIVQFVANKRVASPNASRRVAMSPTIFTIVCRVHGESVAAAGDDATEDAYGKDQSNDDGVGESRHKDIA